MWLEFQKHPLPGNDGVLTRVELLGLIETFNAELLSHSSATATLEHWCAEHGLAPDARIVARLERGADKPLDESGWQLLALSPGSTLRYRHVKLFCGDKLLSEADNWYVPDRLTPEMNRLLDETDTPFGHAIRDLDFRRETLSAKLLWPPQTSQGYIGAPEHILEHRALLRTAAGTPVALVAETYTSGVLGFPSRDERLP